MTILPETLDLARRLLAYEAVVGQRSHSAESAVLRVYEKLRSHLSALAGVTVFQSLASRVLALAKLDAPTFSAAHVTADGSLEGLREPDPKTDKERAEAGEAIFIARLLGLLLTFIGEALTLRLIQDIWPDVAFDDSYRANGEKREYTK